MTTKDRSTSERVLTGRRAVVRAARLAGVVGALAEFNRRTLALDPITRAQAEPTKPADAKTFTIPSATLQSGVEFRDVKLSYKTYGQLAPDRSNVVVVPGAYAGTHAYVDWLTAAGQVLDPSRYFIISIVQLGMGLSSSPSNTGAPYDKGRFPKVTLLDNVRMQHRLVTEMFGVEKIALVHGFSMGGQQAYHWGALYPDMVDRISVACGSARTSVNNQVFLAGIEAALTADPAWQDGWFATTPARGLKAFARVYAGWLLSPAFFEAEAYKQMGFSSLEDFLVQQMEPFWMAFNANDLLVPLGAWQKADISDNELYRGDLAKALGAIKAKALIMLCETDCYFLVEDSKREMPHLKRAQLKPIPSILGHVAGSENGGPQEAAFIAKNVNDLLSA